MSEEIVNDEASSETKKSPEKTREESAKYLRLAMAADEKIDALKSQLDDLLKERSEALKEVAARGVKRFAWKGLSLTIFRKGEGLFSLRGKKQDEKDVFSIDD